MPLPIAPTLGIFSDNLQKRKSVLPLSGNSVTSWANGLDLKDGGETVIYTGQFYQMVPVINNMAKQLHKFEDSWITNYFELGRKVNKTVNMTSIMARPKATEQETSNRIIRNIARLLKSAGVDFGYLYRRDLYSGALVYDEGLDDAFVAHAERVYKKLKLKGVKRLITIDPHTTNMFKSVYPKVIDGFDIEAKSYLEVLAEKGITCLKQSDQEVTIHDSCIYARHEGIVDQPRILLREAGVNIQETELSGKLTHCCGGPAESLFPGKSIEISKNRIEQLSDCAKQIVTMCPLCKASLERVATPGIVIRDISDYLAESYLS
jgi:Fe-S oxidoreductase